MAKLLFTHSYFMRLDPKQWERNMPYPPLMTITAASWLRQEGHEVALFDPMFVHAPEMLAPRLKQEKPDYLVIFDDGFNYLTKMCLTNMREAAFRMSEMASQHGCRVIVCSSDSTDHYEKYLDHHAGFVLLGEGEETLQELINNLEKNSSDPHEIRGLAFREKNETINTGRRQVMKDLDRIPMAAWDLVDLEEYRQRWEKHHSYFSLNLSTTRGCPFKCNWCAKPIYGNRYNTRSPTNVAEEIELLAGRYGARHFWVTDDIFGLKPGWVQEFNNEVNYRHLDFRYVIQSRADLLLKQDTIPALAESGCEEVWIGAESGSQKILDAMDKGITVEQIYRARKKLKENGIRAGFFLQFGYLGEKEKDIRATVKMLMDLMPEEIGVSVSYPLPGTKFYENVKDELDSKANWTDSDELALMFRNTFSPEYYKILHRYVHKLYRSKQGWNHFKDLLNDPSKINKNNLKKAASTLYHFPGFLIHAQKKNLMKRP